MQTIELKKWINYLVFLIFTTVLFFLNLLGVFSTVYSVNMHMLEPVVGKTRKVLVKTIGSVQSFWAMRKLKQENLELAKVVLAKEDKIIELESRLQQCKDISEQVRWSQQRSIKRLHQGIVLNRYYQPDGMILVDFGQFGLENQLKGDIVFYKHFFVGEVVNQQKNLVIIKTLWNSSIRKKVYLQKAKAVGLLVYENNNFKVQDILVKENVSVGDIVYLPGNACVEKLVIGKIIKKNAALGNPKEVLQVKPIMDFNELNYVYMCK